MERPDDTALTKTVLPFERPDRVSVVLWITLMLIMVGVVLVVAGGGWAQTTSDDSKAGYLSGQVTGKQAKSIQIDRRDYPLADSATITDDEDRPRDLNDIKVGAAVRFHLKRDKIDKLVLILPK